MGNVVHQVIKVVDVGLEDLLATTPQAMVLVYYLWQAIPLQIIEMTLWQLEAVLQLLPKSHKYTVSLVVMDMKFVFSRI